MAFSLPVLAHRLIWTNNRRDALVSWKDKKVVYMTRDGKYFNYYLFARIFKANPIPGFHSHALNIKRKMEMPRLLFSLRNWLNLNDSDYKWNYSQSNLKLNIVRQCLFFKVFLVFSKLNQSLKEETKLIFLKKGTKKKCRILALGMGNGLP